MSLQRALLALLAAVALVALLPAGLLIERQLAAEIEAQSRRDLAAAPALARARQAQQVDAMMMHAKDIAQTPGLAAALRDGDHAGAAALAEAARGSYAERAILIDANGASVAGPMPPADLVQRARAGEMPVEIVREGAALRAIALAPITLASNAGTDSALAGVAGVESAVGDADIGALAGLSRADVMLVAGRLPAGSTLTGADSTLTGSIVAAAAAAFDEPGTVVEVRLDGRRYLAAATPLGGPAAALFVRDLDRELAILDRLRRTAAIALAAALGFALLVGAVFAAVLTRPVRTLAGAADRLAGGDFRAPVPRAVFTELRSVSDAFHAMRAALASRLDELERVNRELADRQARLAALQAELIQRDRLAAAGQLVTQLAHEIRNPVANVRNCLELIRRRLSDDESREFADLAIDELLRMHELAEQMLDLHRPRAGGRTADLGAVAAEVAALVRIGAPASLTIDVVETDVPTVASVPPDAVKQVLVNLVRNAREAMADRGRIEMAIDVRDGIAIVEVADDGAGIPEPVLPHLFDPFFTTKDAVHGVGLGLFVAEGVVRGMGGRIRAGNRPGGGARFTVELPLADASAAAGPVAAAGGRADGVDAS